MKRVLLVALLLAGVCAPAACDKKRGMETRTYELTRLTNEEAVALLTPYIREGGFLSGKQKLISVTERPDRQKVIADLLQKYDGGPDAGDVVLDIQVLQADGFIQSDTAIADIETTLREMFKYRGYRLLGSTRVQTSEEEDFLRSTPRFSVRGRVHRVRVSGSEKRVAISIELGAGQVRMVSTVTATVGKPVVLGQSDDAGGAIILVIRPSAAS